MKTDDFVDLARITFLTHLPAGAPEPSPSHIQLLAKLLCAAASGRGALELGKLNLSPQEIAALASYPHIFSLEHGLVLLPRYASHAAKVRAFFEANIHADGGRFDSHSVRRALDAVLPRQAITDASGRVIFDNAHQRLAIAALLDARVGVLTGGPGTGKTATAAALLAIRKRLDPGLLAEQVLVTAPTGKAACRIAESILNSIGHLETLSAEETDFLQAIRSLTLHKALEWSRIPPERGGPFRRNTERPLEARLVLVDEASMVDLSLMHALVRALPQDASLLLLGDSDQLESVEVGGILAELVQRARHAPLPAIATRRIGERLGLTETEVHSEFEGGLPPAPKSPYAPLPGLVFGLQYSRRAMKAQWVLDLAGLVRPGARTDFEEIKACFARHPDTLVWHQKTSPQTRAEHLHKHWLEWSRQSRDWTNFSEQTPAEQLAKPLEKLARFQLLCSTNAQVDRANAEGIRLLAPERGVGAGNVPHGCPIIIQANDRTLGLTNGDVGVALGSAFGAPASVVLFPSPGDRPRLVALAQLPEYRPAFALTIHKSQGSEWSHIAIELPAQSEAALLTRNLLYTAITRSSGKIDLIGSENVLRQIAALA
jgi:exodeoxyribonuclease V alpha subunit